jgi:alpha-glucosidase
MHLTSSVCRTLSIAGLLVLAASHALAAVVTSPDGRTEVTVTTTDDGRPQYAVQFDSEAVILPSHLGLVFLEEANLDEGFGIATEVMSNADSVWEQPWGERRFVRDHYNELLVTFAADNPERQFSVRFRIHDDGVGFRYEVPAQDAFDTLVIDDELTEFRLPVDTLGWWTPGRGWNRYEYHTRNLPVVDITLANTPATFRLANGTHVSLHEAALVNYAGYVLEQIDHGLLKTNLTPWSDGARVKTAAPFVTPWRTIQVAPDAIGLLNSNLVLNLNEPNALGDVSWVEPGRYVGIWWAMHIGERTWGSGPNHGATTEAAKRYIDFAAEHGFSGVLVEGWNTGWDGNWIENGAVFSFTEAYPDFELREVAQYALDSGVRLVGHHETSGHISNYEAQMDDAFALYGEIGVRQVKTGYVAHGGNLQRVNDNGDLIKEWHDGQFAVDHFIRVLETAAKHRVSINTHEPVKDTGLRRTYPNWLTREGARGQEYNSSWPLPNRVDHNVNLAYTRMLAGPLDFTPGIFDLQHQGAGSNRRVQSTLAHQLALYVVLYSPVQMAADLPDNYLARPDAFQFIKDVPTDWEQSIALAGQVGDHVVFARKDRAADDWYVGAITGEAPRHIAVPLHFLDAGRRYTATIYRDGDSADWRSNPLALEVERRTVTAADTLELPLAAGGGAAVRLQAQP